MTAIRCPRCERTMAKVSEMGVITIWARGGAGYEFTPGAGAVRFFCAACEAWHDVTITNIVQKVVEKAI